jgi:hypothetical protein
MPGYLGHLWQVAKDGNGVGIQVVKTLVGGRRNLLGGGPRQPAGHQGQDDSDPEPPHSSASSPIDGKTNRLDAGGYFESGYKGTIDISIKDGRIQKNEQNIRLRWSLP